MLTTINISLPKEMYKDAQKLLKKGNYASISELIRDGMRHILYPEITENGFTREFEDAVLEAEKEPEENDLILKTEADVRNYFKQLRLSRNKQRVDDQNQIVR